MPLSTTNQKTRARNHTPGIIHQELGLGGWEPLAEMFLFPILSQFFFKKKHEVKSHTNACHYSSPAVNSQGTFQLRDGAIHRYKALLNYLTTESTNEIRPTNSLIHYS